MATYYHGTSFDFTSIQAGTGVNTDIQDENVGAGVFLTTEMSDAIFYADRSEEKSGGHARVITCSLSPKARLVEYDDDLAELFADTDAELVEWAEDNGYDGIDFVDGGDVNTPGTVLVLDPELITIN